MLFCQKLHFYTFFHSMVSLVQAVRDRNIPRLTELLDDGVDVNIIDPNNVCKYRCTLLKLPYHPLQSSISPSSKYHITLFKVPYHPLQSTTSPSSKYHITLFKVPQVYVRRYKVYILLKKLRVHLYFLFLYFFNRPWLFHVKHQVLICSTTFCTFAHIFWIFTCLKITNVFLPETPDFSI